MGTEACNICNNRQELLLIPPFVKFWLFASFLLGIFPVGTSWLLVEIMLPGTSLSCPDLIVMALHW